MRRQDESVDDLLDRLCHTQLIKMDGEELGWFMSAIIKGRLEWPLDLNVGEDKPNG